MKFEFNGQEYDTDKPICVLGYKICKDWRAYSASSDFDARCIQKYGAKVKKFYVNDLHFKLVGGVNTITKMLLVTAKHDDDVLINSDRIIGHSPQECMKRYKELLEVAEQ